MLDSAQILPVIEGFATGTPKNVLHQAEAAKFLTSLNCLERNQNRIGKIYENTRIDTRYLAVDLLSEETIAFSQKRNTLEERMQMYEKHAFALADEIARKALSAASDESTGVKIEDEIGLIVFVTSTGFVAPGIDAKLIESLGLKRNIARVPVNFMGCAAAMTGLRVCCDYVRAHPHSKALMVCLELSSVNAVFNDDLNDIIIHSLFGDGCAAAVIGANTVDNLVGRGKFVIKDNFSHLVKNTEDGITLGVKDNGITCLLSRHLPDYIEDGVGTIVKDFLATHQMTKSDIDLWAVHPGGTKIIEKVQLSVGLDDEQVADSWEILRKYGNMLSCSILFVMERMMLKLNETAANSTAEGRRDNESIEQPRPINGLAFSFSPGVGVEGILFEKV
ncbi:3-oxoacyl-[acyl-carrier-protein] synthase III C-terminal domain-containing protein [Chamaesiphon sp. VAR_69_metabat_338]|uniref:type III polyketide synthase n=1 Tax=Chamaesiphon sp. VAR_69_metabat_338 TaxID=2964704 RepID=UPI00286DC215|nr:3-oxoacyl-[acyl-carrier-protein] synthase III C-terminal domain-containing protein [Chamaesiphon sp. VAR_69_metabat_338]